MALNFKYFWENCYDAEDNNIFLIKGDRELSYTEVFNNADALFHNLERGTIAVLCDKNVSTVTAYLGALRNNLVTIMLDSEAKEAAIDRIITAYKPKYLFILDDRIREGYTRIALFENYALLRRDTDLIQSISDELALLLATSGSTGDPKFVRLSHQSLNSCTFSINEYLEMNSSRRCISLLPFHYSYGLSVLNSVVATRASMVLSDFSVLDKGLWELIPRLGITDLSGVPFMFEIIQRSTLNNDVVKSLHCMTQAGGRLDPKITKRMIQKLKPYGIKYYTMYGQTEASPRISYLPIERSIEKLGSVGVPIPYGSVYIAETGLPRGEGELVYRGPNVALGYAKSADDLALGDEFRGELNTGDQVNIDAEGFIYIVGRIKRFIKLQGVSVNLDHVELVLKDHGITCAVIGKENRLVVCYLENDNSTVRICIEEHFSFHMSNVRIQKIEGMPYNSNGKLDYKSLQLEFLN